MNGHCSAVQQQIKQVAHQAAAMPTV